MRSAHLSDLDLIHLERHNPSSFEDFMLPNYDAGAVAEVLGLAFLRGPTDDGSAGRDVKMEPSGRFRSLRHVIESDFIINVDDTALLVVESLADGSRDFSQTEGDREEQRDFSSRLSAPSPVLIEKAVEMGLPRTALRHVAEWLAGEEKAKIPAFERGIVPKTSLERRDFKLSPLESERTERIARLLVHARRALGTAKEAREFMTASHPELDRRTPMDAAKTDLGTRRVERLLTALEYGLAI